MRGGYDPERAARILVDAVALGDKKAAAKWKVTERTIGNYRARLKTDAILSGLYKQIAVEAQANWHLVRNRFLRDVTEHLRELCLSAKADQISDVRAAIKDIGELDLAREAIGVGTGDRQQGPAASETSGGSTGDDEAEDADEGTGTPEGG